MKYGLKRPGDKVGEKYVKIPKGHIEKGVSLDGIDDWANAIFVSPSIKYASDGAYSDRIVTPGNCEWCLLVEAVIRPNGFTKHKHTLKKIMQELEKILVLNLELIL